MPIGRTIGLTISNTIKSTIGRINEILYFVINLLFATSTRNSKTTCIGIASDGTFDNPVLLTVPANMVAIVGGRLATTVADGAVLGSEEIVNGDNEAAVMSTSPAIALTNVTLAQSSDFVFSGSFSGKLTDTTDAANAHQAILNGVNGVDADDAIYLTGRVYIPIGHPTAGLVVYDSNDGSVIETVATTKGAWVPFTFERPPKGSNWSLAIGSNLAEDWNLGSIYLDDVSMRPTIPTWYNTDINGVHLDTALQNYAAGTNKCECVKANPTDLTGVTYSGGGDGNLTLVNDAAELALAGLGDVCTSGNVYKLFSNSTPSFAVISGQTTNINKHSISVYARGGDPTSAIFLGGAGVGSVVVDELTYTRILSEDLTPANASGDLEIKAGIGSTVYFILPQLEENTISTPVMIGNPDTAAAVTRLADVTTSPTPSVLSAESGAIEMVVDPAVLGSDVMALALYVDASNFATIQIEAVNVRFRKFVGGVDAGVALFSYSYAAKTPVRVQIYWDNTIGMGCRAADASADISLQSFITDADTTDTPIPTAIHIGSRNGSLLFIGDYANDGVPITYSSAEAAGWL